VVLEIGTGLGYQSAVLAEVVSRVYSVEIIDELAQQAIQRLKHRVTPTSKSVSVTAIPAGPSTRRSTR